MLPTTPGRHDGGHHMKPSDISLFTPKEQTLLVDTESKRLVDLDEDALANLLTRVRRTRNKYSDLYRRQGAGAVKKSGARSVTSTSNQRTTQKAEILEDAVSRVARHLSSAARANANELKRERLESSSSAASRQGATKPSSATKKGTAPKRAAASAGKGKGKKATDIVRPARKGATSAANKRQQAGKDKRAK
jgi:hypothetical protein